MLRTKYIKKAVMALTLCTFVSTCAAAPPEYGNGWKPNQVPKEEIKKEEVSEAVNNVKTEGLTIQKEVSSATLYTDALTETKASGRKYTTVRRGDFIMEATVAGTVVYPKQKQIRYEFPYGDTYYMEAVDVEKSNKAEGDVIVRIHVYMDEIQLASMERQLQRMEERGETGTAYEDAKKRYVEMQEALNKTEIVMEEDGILLEQELLRFGTKISSYTITVADPKERLLEVSNEGKNFRYGQKVTVSAKIDGVTQKGTGTVITASPNTVSEDLTGTTAYILLDEDSEYLYDGSGISVTVETVHMEDVLLLDISAAYMANGMQMVKLMDEYGLHAVSFSFGRKNASVYWVIDGLEEGAQILVQ